MDIVKTAWGTTRTAAPGSPPVLEPGFSVRGKRAAPTVAGRVERVERRRLAALAETGLVDSPTEEVFDRITRLARRVLGCSGAMVSLVTADRVFVKSQTGLDGFLDEARSMPLDGSLCRYVVAGGDALAIGDTTHNALVARSHLVTGGLSAYAGEPLTTPDGHVLGSLCVVDRTPRAWADDELAVLHDLAGLVSSEVERRRHAQAAERVRSQVARLRDLAGDLGGSVAATADLAEDSGVPRLSAAATRARRQSEDLARLVEELRRDTGRTAGRRTPREVSTDLRERLVRAAAVASSTAQENALALELGRVPVRVSADSEQVEKALTFLLVSALNEVVDPGRCHVVLTHPGRDAVLEVDLPGSPTPVRELLRVLSRVQGLARLGDPDEGATVDSRAGATVVRHGGVRAITSEKGTFYRLIWPLLGEVASGRRGSDRATDLAAEVGPTRPTDT